jgi:ClpP class serine protease
MGEDAIERGLCDEFGGLDDAIPLARQRAGLDPGREVRLVEFPPRPFIDFAALLGGGRPFGLPFGVLAPVDAALAHVAGTPPWQAWPGDQEAVASEAPLAPELFNYARWYLRSLDGCLGEPRVIVAPDILPEGWGLPD